MTGTSFVSRYGNSGFYSKAFVRTPGELLGEGETWHYDDGTIYGIFKSGGAVIGTITGTWYVSGRSIITNMSAVAGNYSYTQNVNASFSDSRSMFSTSTTSYGASINGTSKKILVAPTTTPAASAAPVGGGQVKKPKKGAKGKSPAKAKKSGSKKKTYAKKAKKR